MGYSIIIKPNGEVFKFDNEPYFEVAFKNYKRTVAKGTIQIYPLRDHSDNKAYIVIDDHGNWDVYDENLDEIDPIIKTKILLLKD